MSHLDLQIEDCPALQNLPSSSYDDQPALILRKLQPVPLFLSSDNSALHLRTDNHPLGIAF